MAMARIGVERHIAHDADLGHRFLDRGGCTAGQVSRIERLAAGLIAQRLIRIRKQRDRRDPEGCRLFCRFDCKIDGEPVDPRHGLDGNPPVLSFDNENRPDEVVCRQRMLGNKPSRPMGTPIAPHARRGKTGFVHQRQNRTGERGLE